MLPKDEKPEAEGRPKYRKYRFGKASGHESGAHNSDTHGTEMGWLVSYADMMTLLFGLFVLLFVMTSENNGNVEQKMKEISEQFFSSREAKDGTRIEKITTQGVDPKIVEQLQKEIESLKQIPDQRQLVTELEKRIEELIKNQHPDREELVRQLQEEIERLKEIPDQRQLVAELEKQIEELRNNQHPDREDLVKKLQAEIRKLKQIPDLREVVAQLQYKIQNLERELQKRKIASTDSNKFMLIVTTWSSEKHDVDLIVTDPTGFIYNFKNRRSPNNVGLLEIDSRYGPGLELWKSLSLLPGAYKITLRLYNQYGNKKDAVLKTQIVTQATTLDLPQTILNKEKIEAHYKLYVNEEGAVSVR